MVNLVKREAGDLDWSIGQNQLPELDFELIEIPLSLLAEAIDREPKRALLYFRQVVHPDARNAAEIQETRSFETAPSRTRLSLPIRPGTLIPSALIEPATSLT